MKRASRTIGSIVVTFLALAGCGSGGGHSSVANELAAADHFPSAHWETKPAAEEGMDPARIDDLAATIGGNAVLVRAGYVVGQWGDPAHRVLWHSSTKPLFSTLLFFAIAEGKVSGVDEPLLDWGWALEEKDRTMTFRDVANMTGGYRRPEAPGQAWAYNDYGVQLYQKTLFDRVFREKATNALLERLGSLQFENSPDFDWRRHLIASAFDFARLDWFWLHRGQWNGTQLLDRSFFDSFWMPEVPKSLPVSVPPEGPDYLGIGTYGGGSDSFTNAGPGIYGFNWWFNSTGGLHPNALTWPDAPADTVLTIGLDGDVSVMIPSLGVVLASESGDWGDLDAGNPDSRMNQILAQLTGAVTRG